MRLAHDRARGQHGKCLSVCRGGERFQCFVGLLACSAFRRGEWRFVSRDGFEGSLQNPLTSHRYIYANTNPLTYIDPSGEISLPGIATVLTIVVVLSAIAYNHATTSNVDVGRRVVDNFYGLSPEQQDCGGRCYEIAYDRLDLAFRQVTSRGLPPLGGMTPFHRIWGSLIDPQQSWLQLSHGHRGKGGAGALDLIGRGQLISEEAIWGGHLRPGAIVQTWRQDSDYARVRAGLHPLKNGHSFIFLSYQRTSSGRIIGMRIADQGFQNDQSLTRNSYQYWVAANVGL